MSTPDTCDKAHNLLIERGGQGKALLGQRHQRTHCSTAHTWVLVANQGRNNFNGGRARSGLLVRMLGGWIYLCRGSRQGPTYQPSWCRKFKHMQRRHSHGVAVVCTEPAGCSENILQRMRQPGLIRGGRIRVHIINWFDGTPSVPTWAWALQHWLEWVRDRWRITSGHVGLLYDQRCCEEEKSQIVAEYMRAKSAVRHPAVLQLRPLSR